MIDQSHSLIKIDRPGLQIPGRVTAVGLELPPELQYHQWAEIGHTLNRVGRGLQWWIGDWLNYGERTYGEAYSQAIDATGYDYVTVSHMAYVSSRVEFCRRRQNLSWSHHAEVAPLEPDEQDKFLNLAEREGLTSKELRGRKRSALNPPPPLPKHKFFVLYADPPWSFANTGFHQSAESHYPTITTDELCDRPNIAELVGEQGVLFLWVPNAMIADGLRVCEAWGFAYRTNRTWIKDRSPGLGWYVKSKHETLLIATRGQGVFPKEKPDSWFKAEVEHPRLPAPLGRRSESKVRKHTEDPMGICPHAPSRQQKGQAAIPEYNEASEEAFQPP